MIAMEPVMYELPNTPTVEAIYTVPNLYIVEIVSIWFINLGDEAARIWLWRVPPGEVAGDGNVLINGSDATMIQAGDIIEYKTLKTLYGGYSLQGCKDDADVEVTVHLDGTLRRIKHRQ